MSGMFATPPPMEGRGMSPKFARRAAVISGMPATQQEVAASAARQDFNARTQGIQRQAEADQSKADAQGLGNIVRLMSLMRQQRKDAAMQGTPQPSPVEQRSPDEVYSALQSQPGPYVAQGGPYTNFNDPFVQFLLGMQNPYPFGMPPENY